MNDAFQNDICGVCQLSSADVKSLSLPMMMTLMKSERLNAQNAEAAFKVRYWAFLSLFPSCKKCIGSNPLEKHN